MARSRYLLPLLLALAAGGAEAQASSGPIDPAALSQTVRVLASDAFQGRAPGTPGEALTVDYLIGRFKALGLQPGGAHGAWTQPVPLVRTRLGTPSRIEIDGAGAAQPLKLGDDIYVSTPRPVDELAIQEAPLVFVGYGVSAPERHWDDFKGVDLKGKIAVFLVNDPDFKAEAGESVAGRFGGKAMTFYGRWVYKYEEAARRGALGALIVHETPGAGYGWSTVIAPQGEVYDILRPADGPQPILLQGWLARQTAVALFSRAGQDFAALERSARREDFRPVALGDARLTVQIPVSHVVVQSQNVLARLPGTTRPGETVMFGAHWDAFGVGAPDASGQTIRRGANDDGLGVAGVLELARAFAAGPAPKRSLIFAIWTAEERGLLGSETYAAHPIWPLRETVVNFTMDVLNPAGPARDVVLVGAGQDSLETDLAAAAATQGRTVTGDPHPEKGLFYRADHFSFAKRGIPTLLIMSMAGGPDLVKGGRAAGEAWVDDYTARCYHKTCDAWDPAWDLRGAAQDVDLIYLIARRLADSDAWPRWNASSEFLKLRPAPGAPG